MGGVDEGLGLKGITVQKERKRDYSPKLGVKEYERRLKVNAIEKGDTANMLMEQP